MADTTTSRAFSMARFNGTNFGAAHAGRDDKLNAGLVATRAYLGAMFGGAASGTVAPAWVSGVGSDK